MEHLHIPIPPDPSVLAALPATTIGDTIERLLAELDAREGDPDVELNGDETDNNGSEEDFIDHAGGDGKAGCSVSDPSDIACPEWISLGRHKNREWRGTLPDEDAEDEDQDQCLAADDDPARSIGDGSPGDSYDTELNGDEDDYSDADTDTDAPIPGGGSDVGGPTRIVDRPLALCGRAQLAEPPPQTDPAPEDMPEVYASIAVGKCLEPVYQDGACLVFDKTEQPVPGDYVGIWVRTKSGAVERRVKRLVIGGWPGMQFPCRGDFIPIIIVEQLNPPRRYQIPGDTILSMHKVVGTAKSLANGMAEWTREREKQ